MGSFSMVAWVNSGGGRVLLGPLENTSTNIPPGCPRNISVLLGFARVYSSNNSERVLFENGLTGNNLV